MYGYSDELRRRMLRDTEDFLSRHLNEADRAEDEIRTSWRSDLSRPKSNLWVCILSGQRIPPAGVYMLFIATRSQMKVDRLVEEGRVAHHRWKSKKG